MSISVFVKKIQTRRPFYPINKVASFKRQEYSFVLENVTEIE